MLDWEKLSKVAQGTFTQKTGVTGVTGVTEDSGYVSNPLKLQRLRRLRLDAHNLQLDKNADQREGVTDPLLGVTQNPNNVIDVFKKAGRKASKIPPDDGQEDANRRNREAALAASTDRFCRCGSYASVGVGRVRVSQDNPEGAEWWLCPLHFEEWKSKRASDRISS